MLETTGIRWLAVVVANIGGTPDYIELVEGAGYGGRWSSILSWVLVLALLAVLVAGSVVGVRWFRQKFSSSTPMRLMSPEDRRAIGAAVERGNFQEAAKLLEKAGELYEAADAFMRGGDHRRAARLFEKKGAQGRAIECYKHHGDFSEAAKVYERRGDHGAAAVEYERAEEPLKAARHYEEAGQWERAARQYEAGQRWFEAAEAYDRAGLALRAAEIYAEQLQEEGLEEEGKDLDEEVRKRALRAAELFEAAQRWKQASQIYRAAGEPERAAETLKETGDFATAAALLREAGLKGLAAEFLDEAGDAQEAALARAEAALDKGDLAEAGAEFRRAGDLDRAAKLLKEARQFESAADLYEQLEQWRQAMELYLEVPRYAHAARCAEEAGMLARAAEYYGQASDIDGEIRVLKQAGDLLKAGRLEFEHRRYEEALETLADIDSRDANYARVQELQGDIYRSQGRVEKAYSKYRAVLGDRPAEPATLPLYYKMGRALEEEPDLAGALDCYNQVVAVDAHFEDAELRVQTLRKRMRRGTMTGRHSTGVLSSSGSQGGGVGEQRYEIIEEIARGGMGIVYKAKDTVLGRVVAFKILGANLRDNPTAVRYFLREARAAAALSHSNIVTIYDAGEQEGEYYMAMEYVEGTTLKEMIRSKGALGDEKARHILRHCCKALDYAHGKGVIHRDITSGNVMATADMDLKIMDFGLAKFLKEYQNNHTQQVGTPFYMSPEQIIGQDIDFRSDLYSLGCTVFECATGSVPFFQGDLSYHHIHSPPPKPSSLNPDITQGLERVILKLLEKKPADRFENAASVIEELDRLEKAPMA